MKGRLLDLEAATAAVRPYLRQYLEEKGVNTEKNFSCLNPEHEDSTPSMSMKQDPERAYCFSCGCLCDIFSAAHYLEKRPLKGTGFIEENLLYLAKKYGVDIEMADLTQDEIYEYRTYSAYRLAAKLVADPEFGDYSKANKAIEARGWDPERCAEWGIGTVSYREFEERLKRAGFDAEFLRGIDLNRSNLFGSHNLIFTVFDPNGRPVGFSARNLRYRKDDRDGGPKYNNTRVTGLECNIFKKSERLYGFDIAAEAGSPLYIFEGQADVITARHHGHMNCVCSLGTSFTDHHISLLKRHGCFNLIFVFDSDPSGEEAIQKLMDEKFSQHKEFRVKLIQLPRGMDPDQLFREKGAGEFLRLKRWEAFEWRLSHFEEETDPEEVATKVVPIILAEPSHIRHEKMAKTLAIYTGLDFSTIMSEIKRRRDIKEEELAERKLGILNDVVYRARKNPDNASLLLNEANVSIENLQKEVDGDSSGSTAMVNRVLSQKEEDERKTDEFAGFLMKPDGLGNLAKHLDDNWRSQTWVCLGGTEQAGKCLHFQTLMPLPSGETVTIEEAVRQKVPSVLGINTQKQIVQKKVSNWIDSGELECFEVKTEQGISTKASKTHPYLVLDEELGPCWKEVRDLKEGERIAVLRDKVRKENFADGDVSFDKIVSIKPIGKHQCYDLEIPEGHNFIAEDTIVHNTSMAAQMAYEIAENPENNATCIYLSIDDAAKFILFKLVSNAVNDSRLTLGNIANPNYWKKELPPDQARIMCKLRDKGYNELTKLARDRRIVLKDASDGSSLSFIQSMLRYYRETLPDRNIVLFIDNFHKISDFDNLQGSDRVKKVSNYIKRLTTEYKATIVSTVEYRKELDTSMPSNNSIADSRAIKYDSTVLIHIFNDAHTQDNGIHSSRLIHEHNGELLPRVRCKFGKNKVSGFEGREFFDLYPRWGILKSVDKETALKDIQARQEFLKQQKQNL